MIESVAMWLTLHAEMAPILVFGLLLLTGFSFPLSEDVLVIVSGVVASTVIPEKTISLYIAVFLGSYFSDWIAYGMGRFLGHKFIKWVFFSRTLSEERKFQVENFFRKYGFLTLFFGRLIPFGVRNSIFMVAGAGKMRFYKFLLSDGLSCLLFSSTVFYLAFRCGEGYGRLYSSLSSLGYVMLGVFVVSLCSLILWNFLSKQRTETLS